MKDRKTFITEAMEVDEGQHRYDAAPLSEVEVSTISRYRSTLMDLISLSVLVLQAVGL